MPGAETLNTFTDEQVQFSCQASRLPCVGLSLGHSAAGLASKLEIEVWGPVTYLT